MTIFNVSKIEDFFPTLLLLSVDQIFFCCVSDISINQLFKKILVLHVSL